MPGHDVDGEELPAADALDTDGSSWRQVYARSRKPASSLKKTSVVDTSTEEPQNVLASIRLNGPRPPPLPADDYKIVLRIRGGFNCADTPLPKLIHAILQAAALTRSLQDQYRINAVSNTILVSTPGSERTDAYFQMKTIKMDNRSYEVANHITDPSNTCKGVIRNIPVDHTAETIMSSLLDYDRLGLILTGRRMGATTSVLVTFRGTRVPYYINYQGGVIRRPERTRPAARATQMFSSSAAALGDAAAPSTDGAAHLQVNNNQGVLLSAAYVCCNGMGYRPAILNTSHVASRPGTNDKAA
ncbi:hypothetical protein HPB50_029520 [Hyalomma asiaticum]|nr:hypothetical protein HPB50_029520 [Hyalomma asiaticum]